MQRSIDSIPVLKIVRQLLGILNDDCDQMATINNYNLIGSNHVIVVRKCQQIKHSYMWLQHNEWITHAANILRLLTSEDIVGCWLLTVHLISVIVPFEVITTLYTINILYVFQLCENHNITP